MHNSLRVILAVFALILVLSATGFVVWTETPSQPIAKTHLGAVQGLALLFAFRASKTRRMLELCKRYGD